MRRAIAIVVLALASIAGGARASAETATAWPAADELFRADPRWLGSDAAFSIDLGAGRVLWIFNDTYVARGADAARADAYTPHNTVAIERGYDPATASIAFFWNHDGSKPTAIFPTVDHVFVWPTSGVRDGNELWLFGDRVGRNPQPGHRGNKDMGWNAYLITNPDAEPSAWQMTQVAAVDDSVILGSQVLVRGDYLYVYGVGEGPHDLYLGRVPRATTAADLVADVRWWTGDGWSADAAQRRPVIAKASSETSVQRDPRGSGYIEINWSGATRQIVQREAPAPEGPWSQPHAVYTPPEDSEPGVAVYAAKSHPELAGADLVLTYATNGPGSLVLDDMALYYPRFVRVTLDTPR